MTYELAKKLRDAGFPQKGEGHGLFEDGEKINSSFIGAGTMPSVYVPTLSELIGACGESFGTLEHHRFTHDTKGWRAYMTQEAFDKSGVDCVLECDGYGAGDTPEEAVTDLWLALKHA